MFAFTFMGIPIDYQPEERGRTLYTNPLGSKTGSFGYECNYLWTLWRILTNALPDLLDYEI